MQSLLPRTKAELYVMLVLSYLKLPQMTFHMMMSYQALMLTAFQPRLRKVFPMYLVQAKFPVDRDGATLSVSKAAQEVRPRSPMGPLDGDLPPRPETLLPLLDGVHPRPQIPLLQQLGVLPLLVKQKLKMVSI